jgi:hypothetical protein
LKRARSVILVLGGLGAVACDQTAPSVYTARFYDPVGKCLEDYTSIGLVDNGKLSALCPPTCLLVGADLYVSTVCGPYPDEGMMVLPAKSQDCVAAIALLQSAKGTCGAP